MRWLFLQLILLGQAGAVRFAELAALPLSAPERLTWERERIAAFKRGEGDAFSDLYRAYAGLLYARIVLPLLRQPAAAEDVLADTFVRAHAALAQVRVEDRSVFFWLARIARNRALDLQRRTQIERLAATKLGRAEPLQLPEPSPESRLSARDEEREGARRIAAAMQRLHPRYGHALRLRILEERSREECASELGITVATFDVVLLRALRAFRRLFEETLAT